MKRNYGLIITCVLTFAIIIGCGQKTADQLPESQEAKQLLQGIWSDEETENLVFQMRGDSVY